MSMHPLGTSGLRKRTRADALLEIASGGPRARPWNQTSPSCSNSLATCSDNPPVLAFLKLLKSRMTARRRIMRASIIMSMLLARPIATELTGDRELLEHSQFLDPKRTTADDHKILRIPKWGLLPLTLRARIGLSISLRAAGMDRTFDDHVVQGHEKDMQACPLRPSH